MRRKRRRLKKGFRYAFTITGIILIVSLAYFVVSALSNDTEVSFNILNNYLSSVQIDKESAREEINSMPVKEKYTYTYLSFYVDGEPELYYSPSGSGYRYGPSIINNEDGSRDYWFARQGNNSTEWDYIAYTHQDAEGNFSDEQIVLKPTKGSLDRYSVCDPGVIYFNDYYYLAYTSTVDPTDGGVNNELYVARSKYPDGPFEKWNGEGWGGNPKPIIEYDNYDGGWGVGEPSFVIKDDVLYLFYSYIDLHNNVTRVKISDLSENWPLNLTGYDIVINKINNQDSADVVYLDDYDKFVAFAATGRLTETSGVIIWVSDDGKNFEDGVKVQEGFEDYLHNIGISKNKDGHISMDDDLVIGYAYSANDTLSWGRWCTKIQPIKMELITEEEYR
ncbi:MAG: hypothetical protein PUC86_01740 [Solobacterium sp.]|nr:hypothetical protein [Erysipelotrichaceae bacterium]MCI7732865.1 hypothetical protein [Solobacterium sp.]MDD5842281.1 hypothetical protein [Solobacterium sp.]MDD5982550.1 hypothetical protein [Solobacterium sp.]MDD6121615.1 hypothetical protein [Solobacterium sp.]